MALFVDRVTPLNRERAALLRDAEARGGGTAPLKDLLHALLAPPLRWWLGPSRALAISVRFLVRAYAETTPGIRAVLDKDVAHLERFLLALARTLPGRSHAELCWCLHFALGVMHYTIAERRRLEALSAGACDLGDVEAIIRRMVEFVAGGFAAAAVAAPARKRRR